jgi:hypothetical protein
MVSWTAGRTRTTDELSGDAGIAPFPARAIPADNVSLAEIIREIYAQLGGTTSGSDGVTTYPNGAAPANAVSVVEVLRYIHGVLSGTAAGENGITTFPAAAAAGNNVSLAEVIRYIQESQIGTLANTGGTATLGAMIGDLANVSLLTRLAVTNAGGTATLNALLGDFANVALVTRLAAIHPVVATGTTDIDDSEQDESSAWFPLLTITPAASTPLRNVEVFIDLDKATTGFGTVESSATIQFRVARKIDGTNWRGAQTGSPADQLSATISGTNAGGSDMAVMLRPGFVGVTEEVRIEAKMSADATGDMELPYAVIYEGRAAPTITPVAAA